MWFRSSVRMVISNVLYYFNSLWSSDAIWRHRSRSTLAQGMACCLTAPSHYLNQYWIFIKGVLWQSSGSNFPSVHELMWCIIAMYTYHLMVLFYLNIAEMFEVEFDLSVFMSSSPRLASYIIHWLHKRKCITVMHISVLWSLWRSPITISIMCTSRGCLW